MVPKIPEAPLPRTSPPHRANLDESVVLDEDGVTGQVPMDDGGVTNAGSCGSTGAVRGASGKLGQGEPKG